MSRTARRDQRKNEATQPPERRPFVRRLLVLAFPLAFIAGVAVAHKDPSRNVLAKTTTSDTWRQREPTSVVQIPRGPNGDFAVQTRINGVQAAMVVDTGASSVVLTYETARAIGLPLELLEYNIDLETASGHAKAARLWLDRVVIGKLVERSVPALIVPQGLMKTNLLGMSFLDRLEGFEVRADQLMLRGFQEPAAWYKGRA